ncbi:MAG: hypothetical protein ACXVCY_17750 [Pseudobdellovibrionaceae bacterium]
MKSYKPYLISILMPILSSVSIFLTACASKASSFFGNTSILITDTQLHPSMFPHINRTPVRAPSGGGSGDAGGGNNDRPTDEDIRRTLEKLRNDTTWAWLPLQYQKYLDSSGEAHFVFTVSAGNSPALTKLLTKMHDDIILREDVSSAGRPSKQNIFQVKLKDKGPCFGKDGKKEASAEYNNLMAPICMSLEYIKSMTPKATLQQSMKSLLMHEFAHQHGADEVMAKQIERYYDRPAVQQFKLVQIVSATFNFLRVTLKTLAESLQTNLAPYSDPQLNETLTNAQICELIKSGYDQALLLQDQVIQTDFIQDAQNSEDSPRIVLTNQISGLKNFCYGNGENAGNPLNVISQDRNDLLIHLKETIKTYDSLAQEFSKKSGVFIMDFSSHLWPYGSYWDQGQK